MRCDEVRNHQMSWVDGKLPEPERKRILAHLEACAPCREAFAEEHEWATRFGRVREGIAGADFIERVFDRIDTNAAPGRATGRAAIAEPDSRARHATPRFNAPIVRRVAAAALLLALVTGAIAVATGAPSRAAPWLTAAATSPLAESESAAAVGERVRSITTSAAGLLDFPMRAIEGRIETIPYQAALLPDPTGKGMLPAGIIVLALAAVAILGFRARRELIIEEVYRS